MDGMGKASQVEFGKSINAVSRRFRAKLDGKAKDQATPLYEGVKSGRKSKIPPCLSFGPDARNLGLGAKTEQPPVAKLGHKANVGDVSISTEM